jgi:IS30 family transposase
LASGVSFREIARHLGRAASTVSREVARHGGRSAYRAYAADQQAWNAGLPPKRCLLAVNSELRDVVASKLILDWSPEQIAGWLKAQYPNNESMRVSHETIYRSLFIQARGELMDHLRSKPVMPANTWTSPWADRRRHLDPRRTGKRKTARFPVTGKEICWPEERTATLRRWWNGTPVSSC